jgi:hypothetical protein
MMVVRWMFGRGMFGRGMPGEVWGKADEMVGKA